MDNKPKKKTRSALGLTPMEFYDTETIARDLEAKAARGLHLREVGTTFLHFDRGEPEQVRYQVECAPKRGWDPDEEYLDYCDRAGWEYVGCIRGMLYVLRAVRPDAETLHTDPVVRAMSMRRAVRSAISNAVVGLLGLLFLIGLLVWSGWREGIQNAPLALLIADVRTPFLLVFVLGELITALLALGNAARINRFRRALARGETPPPDPKGFRRLRRCGRANAILLILALVAVLTPFLGLIRHQENIAGRDDLIYVPLEVWQNDPDYAPTPPMGSGGVNIFACVEYGASLLTTEQYQIYESGQVTDFGLPEEIYGEDGGDYVPRATTDYYRLYIHALADDLGRQLLSAAVDAYEKECRKYGLEPNAGESQSLHPEGLDGALLSSASNRQWLAAWKDGQVVFVTHYGPDNSASALEYLAGLLV